MKAPFVRRAQGILARIFRGEDVFVIRQDQAAWDRQYKAGAWDRLKSGEPHSALLAGLVLDRFAGAERVSLLDVGCGNGGLARLLERIRPEVAYTGIDISEAAIEAARALAPKGSFLVAPAESPPELPGPFDAVVFADVLYYMDPVEVAARYRAAAPDALVLISFCRSWRSAFLWPRIRRGLSVEESFELKKGGLTWDIAVARFRPPVA